MKVDESGRKWMKWMKVDESGRKWIKWMKVDENIRGATDISDAVFNVIFQVIKFIIIYPVSTMICIVLEFPCITLPQN